MGWLAEMAVGKGSLPSPSSPLRRLQVPGALACAAGGPYRFSSSAGRARIGGSERAVCADGLTGSPRLSQGWSAGGEEGKGQSRRYLALPQTGGRSYPRPLLITASTRHHAGCQQWACRLTAYQSIKKASASCCPSSTVTPLAATMSLKGALQATSLFPPHPMPVQHRMGCIRLASGQCWSCACKLV